MDNHEEFCMSNVLDVTTTSYPECPVQNTPLQTHTIPAQSRYTAAAYDVDSNNSQREHRCLSLCARMTPSPRTNSSSICRSTQSHTYITVHTLPAAPAHADPASQTRSGDRHRSYASILSISQPIQVTSDRTPVFNHLTRCSLPCL